MAEAGPHRFPRPAGVARSALSAGSVALALVGIARTTGSGWLMTLVAGVGAVLTVGFVLPAIGLLRVALSASAPRDGTAGLPVLLSVRVDRRTPLMKLRSLDPPGDWAALEGPVDGELVATPRRRGLVSTLRFELRSASPLGLFQWKRVVAVRLERPLEVGPAPANVRAPRLAATASGGQLDNRTTAAPDDLVRSVREYVAGDPIKLVHWPASARAGDLVVKELEAPDRPALAIVVDLRVARGRPDAAEETEARASVAAGVALTALASGYRVILLTAEAGGPRAGAVAAAVDVSRRLARAVAGPPAEGPIAGATLYRVGS